MPHGFHFANSPWPGEILIDVPLIGRVSLGKTSYGLCGGMSLIIDRLAPTFSGQRNQLQALKLGAYSSTAAWLASIFGLIPGLGFLTILGLYSLYLLYVGVPVLMKVPEPKVMGYTVSVIIAALVIFFAIGPASRFLFPYPAFR